MNPKIKSYPFSTVLGWSPSRYDAFNYCKRRYFYNYYAKFDREFGKDKLGQLKTMSSHALEVGIIAHDIIAEILKRIAKSSDPINQSKLEDRIRLLVNETLRNKVLMEVYYGEREPVAFEELFEPTRKSVDNFISSDRFIWALQMDQIHKRSWVIEPEGFGETRLGGLKAYCKVDFMLFDGNQVHVLDWKTGKTDAGKYKRQLTAYAIFAREVMGVPMDAIKPTLAFVRDNYTEIAIDVNERDADAFIQSVHSETQEMFNMTLDIDLNIPKDKSEFPMTESVAKCAYCEFRELCSRNK